MMKWTFFLLIISILATSCSPTGKDRKPHLVMIGGALRYDNSKIFRKMIELSGGRNSRIAVFPTASGNPLKYGSYALEAFQSFGADPILIPLAIKNITPDYRQVREDPDMIDLVKSCGGVYFTGGAQERITEALFYENGDNSPLLDAILQVYSRGGMIAGTSAGAAVMSRIMIRDAQDVFNMLVNGAEMGKEIDRGLGLVPDSLFIDQHFFTRGRFARTLVVMQQEKFKYGIGIDENTAVIMDHLGNSEVLGYSGILLIDMKESEYVDSKAGFCLSNVKISYLEDGDRFNPFTGEIILSEAKYNGTIIDPSSPEFIPYYKRDFFYNDILANSVLKDLLRQFIDNDQKTVKALAFHTSEHGITDPRGYRFVFRKTPDSIGYYSGKKGGENYSVLNIYLDVEPVSMKKRILNE